LLQQHVRRYESSSLGNGHSIDVSGEKRIDTSVDEREKVKLEYAIELSKVREKSIKILNE